MILYNITYNIDHSIDAEWKEWIRNFYIPAVMRSGCFREYKVYRMLKSEDDGSINYAIQFFADSIEALNKFLENEAPSISGMLQEKFANRHVAFMTVLQETGL